MTCTCHVCHRELGDAVFLRCSHCDIGYIQLYRYYTEQLAIAYRHDRDHNVMYKYDLHTNEARREFLDNSHFVIQSMVVPCGTIQDALDPAWWARIDKLKAFL